MFSFIAMLIAVLAVVMGYSGARRFVRDRLRYVDGAQKGTAPIIAGIVAFLIALPVVWLLPENEDFEPIKVDLKQQSMLIEGVVVGVIRRGKGMGL